MVWPNQARTHIYRTQCEHANHYTTSAVTLIWHLYITRFITRLTWRVSLVEQELLTHPEHLSSPPVFSGVRVSWSLVLYVCFVDRCLFFCTFSFGYCVVCSSSLYRFWLPHWYLQTLLETRHQIHTCTVKVSKIFRLFLLYLVSSNSS